MQGLCFDCVVSLDSSYLRYKDVSLVLIWKKGNVCIGKDLIDLSDG